MSRILSLPTSCIPETIGLYKGVILASGGGDILPSGWSVTKSDNTYNIIHNLNLLNLPSFILTATPLLPPNNNVRVYITWATNNVITLRTWTGTSTPIQSSFTFIGVNVYT